MPKKGRGRGVPASQQASSDGASGSGGGQGRGRGGGRGQVSGRGEGGGRGQPEMMPGGRGRGRAPVPDRRPVGPAWGPVGGQSQDVRQAPVGSGAPFASGAPSASAWGQGPMSAGRGAGGRGPVLPVVAQPAASADAPRGPQLTSVGAPSASLPGTFSQISGSWPSSALPSAAASAESSSVPAASSASSGSSSSKDLAKRLTGLELVPGELKLGLFPRRPDRGGNQGHKMVIRVNHFRVLLRPDIDLCHYDVTIHPEVTARAVNRAVMNEVVRLYRQPREGGPHLGGRLPAFDGMKNLYTSGMLPGGEDGLVFENINPADEAGRTQVGGQDPGPQEPAKRQRSFRVVIKFAARVSLHALGEFLAGRFAEQPQDSINALDIVLRERPVSSFIPVGRSFFSPDFGRPAPLGGGVLAVRGFFQSLRPCQAGIGGNQGNAIQGLSLNVDMSSTAFMEPIPVHGFVSEFLMRRVGQAMSDADRRQVLKVLRNVRVEATHQPFKRRYRISGITQQPAKQLRFDVLDEDTGRSQSVSLVAYFRNKYQRNIEFPELPCLECGTNPAKRNWLPMEFCVIVANQRYARKLTPQQTSGMLTAAKQYPRDRERDILTRVRDNAYNADPFAQEFGIRVDTNMMEVQARVLAAPQLKYADDGRMRDCTPRDGAWNMRDKRVVDGAAVRRWACINFCADRDLRRDFVPNQLAEAFCQALAQSCNVTGLRMAPQMLMPVQACPPFSPHVENKIREVYALASKSVPAGSKQAPLDFVLCILPTSNNIYGDIKRVSELEVGLVTQCMLSKHVEKKSLQYLANLALKINPKVGGRNTWLVDAKSRRLPVVSQEPTILIGADVTHPGAGDDSAPSIAAVVANQDWPEMCTYRGLARTQPSRKEIIEELYCEPQRAGGPPVREGMVTEMLRAFQEASRVWPQRIIFFRDGVSEGQFDAVRDLEIHAVRKACTAIDPGYKPKITFVVVQKRHHTRMFPTSQQGADRSGNVLPGTVVDSDICHPTQYDFFLCSHAGLLGVSRPAKYVVLWDENKFGSNDLQLLVNNLCYTYASCTRSVSVVPPAYYAHKLAFRARFYLPPDASDSGSRRSGAGGRAAGDSAGGASSSSRSSRDAQEAQNYPMLPDLRDHVKKVMFYC